MVFVNIETTLIAANTNGTVGTLITILFTILLLTLMIVGAYLLMRTIGQKKSILQEDKNGELVQIDEHIMGVPTKTALIFVIILGMVIRIIFGMTIKGDALILQNLTSAVEHYKNTGLRDYYGDGQLYPIAMYIFSLFGGIIGSGLSTTSVGLQLLLKLPLFLAEIGIVVLLYKIAKKYTNLKVGFIVASLYFLNPLFLMSTSMATSSSVLVAFFLLASFYLMINKKYFAFIAVFFLAILTDSIALLFVVPVLIYSIYLIAKGIKACKLNGVDGMMQDKQRAIVVLIPLYFIVGVIASALIAWPLMAVATKNAFLGVFDKVWFSGILDNYGTFSDNALSIYNIFLRNGIPIGDGFPVLVFFIIFFLLACGIVLSIYLSKKNRANFVLITAFVVVTIATYYIGATAYSMLPALVLLLFAFILIKDRRILKIFTLFSLLIFVNAIAALIHSGNFANVITGTGETHLISGGGLAINIICTVLAVIIHVYFTMVTLDICMNNKVNYLKIDENARFMDGLKAVLWKG